MIALLAGAALTFSGGLAALLAGRRARLAGALGAASASLGGALILVPALEVLRGGAPLTLTAQLGAPWGAVSVGLDPLSAWFAVPLAVLGAVGALYGASYLPAHAPASRTGVAWFSYNTLLAGMLGVLVARDATLFLVTWELMSLAGWGLVSFEHRRPEVRRAGLVYLAAAHLGTALLLSFFLVLRHHTGESALLTPLAVGSALPSVLLALAIGGFGAKAGLIPLHVWLPEAHAAAPSHGSALMSGVMVKIGVYGLLRAALLVGGGPPWFGPVLVALGLTGALVGIRMSITQRELKRALALSTVENVGLIVMGIGLGAWAAARGATEIAALAYGGALLHVWGHGLMKGLLFLGAGSVMHGAHTGDMEHLGGLMRRMPWTGALLALGAVAIAGLPPLSGFAAEWLLYLSLAGGGAEFTGLTAVSWLVVLGALALVGGLASLAFVRLIGIAILGSPRSDRAATAVESPRGMLVPMGALAAAVVGLGAAPGLAVGLQGGVLTQLAGPAASPPDLSGVSLLAAALWGGLAVGGLLLWALLRRGGVRSGETWGCGYASPSPTMQYTGRSLGQILAQGVLVKTMTRPEPTPLHPAPARLDDLLVPGLLGAVYVPTLAWVAARFLALRRRQAGNVHLYLAYMGVGLVLALAWATLSAGGAP
ncbi:MAG: oxidoreductase [Deltaproteobacteria bacterium]|nr:oxidoreductase [Deltaproteobacteria bacterium]